MIYYLLAILAVVATVIAQILLKFGAIRNKNAVSVFINIFNICGYFLLLLATVLNLFALKGIELNELIVFLPLSYILVPLLATFFFKEKLSKKQIAGIAIIAGGIVIFKFNDLIANVL